MRRKKENNEEKENQKGGGREGKGGEGEVRREDRGTHVMIQKH